MFKKEAHEFQKQIQQEYLDLGKNGAYPPLWERIGELWGKGAEFGYNKANEWHNLNENYKDLPNEGEWVEGLYIWYYKDEPHWDIFKVRWCYEIGELDEKLVRWYSSDETNWNKVDEPDYWRKITLPTRNKHDKKY